MKFKFFETLTNGVIDNREITLEEIREKFEEEVGEVLDEINAYKEEPSMHNSLNLLREILDVIQVVILILFYLRNTRKDFKYEITRAYVDHTDKLSERKWRVGKEYEIEIKD